MPTPEKTFEVALTPQHIEVGRLPAGHVGVLIDTPAMDALLPAGRLIIRMTPEETRALATALNSMADAVDGARLKSH